MDVFIKTRPRNLNLAIFHNIWPPWKTMSHAGIYHHISLPLEDPVSSCRRVAGR